MRIPELVNKFVVAQFLRDQAEGSNFEVALGAIRGLGELGGPEALRHLGQLIDKSARIDGQTDSARWAALLEALGMAARHVSER